MITPWQIYWLTRLDYFSDGFCIAATALFLIASIWLLVVAMEGKRFEKKALPLIIVGVIVLFLSVFIPTTKEMAAIILIPKIVNNEKIQELPNNIMDLANEWLKELKPGKKE